MVHQDPYINKKKKFYKVEWVSEGRSLLPPLILLCLKRSLKLMCNNRKNVKIERRIQALFFFVSCYFYSITQTSNHLVKIIL